MARRGGLALAVCAAGLLLSAPAVQAAPRIPHVPPGLPGEPWEHVSVSTVARDRVPDYQEFCWIKDLFFGPDEWVVTAPEGAVPELPTRIARATAPTLPEYLGRTRTMRRFFRLT